LPLGAWRIFVVTPNRTLFSELQPILSHQVPNAQVVEVTELPNKGNLGVLGEFTAGTICFLDVLSSPSDAMETLQAVVADAPKMATIAIVPDRDPQRILQALRLGAREFLTHPFSEDQVGAVLEKLSQFTPDLAGERGRIFTLVPAKGACGASTIAYNLSAGMRRAGSKETLLADLDPHAGTQAFQMKLKPAFSFLDALGHASHLDVDIWRGIVQQANGFDVLLPPDSITDGAAEATDARMLLEFAKRLYSNIVVDIGAAYGPWALSAVRSADEVVVVSTNELPALQAAQRVLNYYESNGIPRQRIRLVINRFSKDVGLSKEMVETALQTDVYFVLPSDYEAVQRALLDGKSISLQSNLGKQINLLAARLMGVEARAKPAEKKANSTTLSGLFSLFSRS
jgi:pilus assembly protein CpaE